MDGTINNPQHYTPLSHALNPPFAATRPRSPYAAPPYDTQHQHPQQPQDQQSADHHDPAADSSNRLEEEEEEEEEEEVEGAVVHHTTTTTTTANDADAQPTYALIASHALMLLL